MSLRDAIQHQPCKLTYAISIFSSWSNEKDKVPLQESPMYRRIVKYIFDDCVESDKNNVAIDSYMAESIVRNFAEYKDAVDALLVHCILGKNRSPAVAIALNEIFELGHDRDKLKEKYSKFNWHVYEKLLESAQRLQL